MNHILIVAALAALASTAVAGNDFDFEIPGNFRPYAQVELKDTYYNKRCEVPAVGILGGNWRINRNAHVDVRYTHNDCAGSENDYEERGFFSAKVRYYFW